MTKTKSRQHRYISAILYITLTMALFACFSVPSSQAQAPPNGSFTPQLLSFVGAPTGVCDIYQQAIDRTTGNYYSCDFATRTWVAVGGNGGAASSLYTVSISGSTITAASNSGGAAITGTDIAVVMNSIFAANATTCGTVYFKQGIYPINSATHETTSSYTNFYYSIGIPANAGSTNQYCQWHFVGEQAAYFASGTSQTQGVIFDYTTTALTACGSGNECIAWWHRPDTTNHVGNDVFFENVSVRFPNNQRGNEAAFLMWEAGTVDYQNVAALVATAVGPPNSPAGSPAVAGANHMIGISSTMCNRNEWQHFRDTTVNGYDIAYDWESEHMVVDSAAAVLNNYYAQYGRLTTFGGYACGQSAGGSISHPSVIINAVDAENVNGVVLGVNLGYGSRLDITGYDIEQLTTTAFARSTNFTETNLGYSSGIITYTLVNASGVVVTEQPAVSLFSAGGTNFQMFEGTTAPNIQQIPASVNFAALPQSTTTWGPAWVSNVATDSCAIAATVFATTLTGGGGTCIQHFAAQNANADQFSKITIAAITSAGAAGAMVRASTTAGTQTYYQYSCSTSGSATLAKRTISKQIAGTPTTLIATGSNSGCVATDTMELDVMGTTLYAYHNGTLDLTTTDSSIASGLPGAEVVIDTGTGLSAWSGGNLSEGNGFSALEGNSGSGSVAPYYYTQTNCAAIGTAASPSVASCGSAAAGQFSCATNATGATCQVNTTAVGTNSEIFVLESDTSTTGTRLGVTCNTSTTVNPTTRLLGTITAGTGFVINLGTVTTNPACFSYWIVNQ